MNRRRLVRSLVLATLVSLPLVAGCTPKGQSGGRIDPSVTTEAEANSKLPLMTVYMEFSDQVAQKLVQDLSQIPQIRDAGTRVTVFVGDLQNKTTYVSSTEFEMVRSRLRNNLLQSPLAKARVRFVEKRARMSELANQEMGSPAAAAGPAPYDPSTTFVLNGDFYGMKRGSVYQYYMEFQLVHMGTNEIVFSERYDHKKAEMDRM